MDKILHDINPRKYDVKYYNHEPAKDDTVILFDGDHVSCRIEGNEAILPKWGELTGTGGRKFVYLFSIDNERYFMAEPRTHNLVERPAGYEMHDYSIFREVGPRHTAFAVVTAQHLHQWYTSREYCGVCGAETVLSEKERAYVCPRCETVEYPKIAPGVIVAVMHGDYLLLTRYRNRPYRRYALIAGYTEVGESLEDTARREVYEEAGIGIKNLRYYKSQPWGFSLTLLAGFFCELDGDPQIVMDEDELSEAVWVRRGEIPLSVSDISLTAEMIEMFRTGSIDEH